MYVCIHKAVLNPNDGLVAGITHFVPGKRAHHRFAPASLQQRIRSPVKHRPVHVYIVYTTYIVEHAEMYVYVYMHEMFSVHVQRSSSGGALRNFIACWQQKRSRPR